MAVTGEKAKRAFKAAEAMAEQVAALEALEDPPEGEVAALKDSLDRDDSMPAPSRASLRTRVRPALAAADMAAGSARTAARCPAAQRTACSGTHVTACITCLSSTLVRVSVCLVPLCLLSYL